MTVTAMSTVLRVPPAAPAAAAAHFAARLTWETDVSDVHADLEAGVPGLVVVDVRSRASWDQGHVPGAVHLPTAEIPARAVALLPREVVAVAYCWGPEQELGRRATMLSTHRGPACNGAVKGALALAGLGYRVKELLGGFEYWVREGLPIETATGRRHHLPDPLTAPVASGVRCDC